MGSQKYESEHVLVLDDKKVILTNKDSVSVANVTVFPKSKTTAFLERVRKNSASVKTPILPPGTVFYEKRGKAEVIVLEERPVTRLTHWEGEYWEKDEPKEEFYLSFPYVILAILISKGTIVSSPDIPAPAAFFRNQPVTSMKDSLCCTNLKNVGSEQGAGAQGWLCIYPTRWDAKNVIEAAEIVRENLWQSVFNNTMERFSDYSRYAKSTTGEVEEWEKKTKKNPLFVLNTKWHQEKTTVKTLVEKMFSGLREDREEEHTLKTFEDLVDVFWQKKEPKGRAWTG